MGLLRRARLDRAAEGGRPHTASQPRVSQSIGKSADLSFGVVSRF